MVNHDFAPPPIWKFIFLVRCSFKASYHEANLSYAIFVKMGDADSC